jgi:hypothetical protein
MLMQSSTYFARKISVEGVSGEPGTVTPFTSTLTAAGRDCESPVKMRIVPLKPENLTPSFSSAPIADQTAVKAAEPG